MVLLAIGWVYVVLMMALVEATSSSGSVLGAFVTFLLYAVLPLSIALYLLGTPARRRRRAETSARAVDPDRGDHASGDTVAPEREES